MMNTDPTSPKRRSKSWMVALVISGALIALYTLIGFFILPAILESQIPKILNEQFNLNSSVDDIDVNPYALSVRVTGFQIEDPGGGELVAYDDLVVNFGALASLGGTIHFDEIFIQRPRGQVIVLPDGTFNFSALMGELSSTQVPIETSGKLPPLSIGRLEISAGRVTFEDRNIPTPYATEVGPINLTLDNISTLAGRHSPYSMTADLASFGQVRWEGDVSLQPLGSRGAVDVSLSDIRPLLLYIRDFVNFEIIEGSLELGAQYHVRLASDGLQLTISDGSVALSDFKLSEKGKNEAIVMVPEFITRGVQVDLGEKRIGIASIQSREGRITGWMTADGRLWVEDLMRLENLGEYQDEVAEFTTEIKKDVQEWHFRIDDIQLHDFASVLYDYGLPEAARFDLAPIHLELSNLSNDKNAKTKVAVRVQDPMGGKVSVQGTTSIDPLAADLTLQVSNISLKQFQRYVDPVANLTIISGITGIDGRIQVAPPGEKQPVFRFGGNLGLKDLNLSEPSADTFLVKIDSLDVNGLTFEADPNQLSVSEVITIRPMENLIIYPDGKANVQKIIAEDPSGREAVSRSLLGEVVDAIKLNIKGPVPITLDHYRLVDGSASITDFSIEPGFELEIDRLNGDLKGVSSVPGSRADIKFTGRVGQHAPLIVSGKVSPFSEKIDTHLIMALADFDVSELSPYAGKYAGYPVTRGKLNLNVEYELSKDRVTGQNRILVKKLTLGEPTNSPDAVDLPIKLGVVLLKDSQGDIRLDLPVEGSLDDPSFSVTATLAGTLANLITKAASSPFAAVGMLSGAVASERPDQIRFGPGSHALGMQELEKLQTLAKTLKERSALGVEIQGQAGGSTDRLALLTAQIEKNSRSKTDDNDADTEKSELERLRRLYREIFGEDPPAFAEDVDEAVELERMIIEEVISGDRENVRIDGKLLVELAKKRARAVQNFLLEKEQVNPNQVSVVNVEILKPDHKRDVFVALFLRAI